MTKRYHNVILESLVIGFITGNRKKILLPPLSARAEKGELISVIGKNGIGKSTLLRSLAGIQDTLGGKIIYNGKELAGYQGSELARLTGYISTEQIKVSNMTVYDLVALGRFPHTNWIGTLDQEDISVISEAMKKTSVLEYSDKYVAELSDGERQRAMIARLLAQDAGIFLMDEPTAFLDIRSKFEIIHLLHGLSHSAGKTIIFTTHDLDLALRHSDKMWLISDSGIKEGAPEDLMIGGMFDHLFESSVVRFNSEDGSYSFNDKPKGVIYVEGEPVLCRWTGKALIRAGFSVSPVKIRDTVEITPDRKWILNMNGSKREYSSIYDLTRDISDLI